MPNTEQRRRCSYRRSLELLLYYPLRFRSVRLLVVALGRSSWWQLWPCDHHDFFFEAPPPGYAVLWAVCSRERGCCPIRYSLRFTIFRLGGWSSIMVTQLLRIASGTLAQWEHAICKLGEILHFKSNSSPEGVHLPAGITRTRNFCEFCTTSIPVQTTSVSSVRHSYAYPELL